MVALVTPLRRVFERMRLTEQRLLDREQLLLIDPGRSRHLVMFVGRPVRCGRGHRHHGNRQRDRQAQPGQPQSPE
jgi:hypothetical protein